MPVKPTNNVTNSRKNTLEFLKNQYKKVKGDQQNKSQ
jgi:hypothetical protein